MKKIPRFHSTTDILPITRDNTLSGHGKVCADISGYCAKWGKIVYCTTWVLLLSGYIGLLLSSSGSESDHF